MTAEQIAFHIEAVLLETDEGGLSIEAQIVILQRILDAMREALS